MEINAWNCFIWLFNRSPNQFCTGTDLNRNWGYHWNDGGSSNNPCSDSYMGKSAFSEIENQNVRDFLLKHKDTIKYYVNLHSYSQLVLLPWGYTEEPMPVYDRYLEVANKVWIYFNQKDFNSLLKFTFFWHCCWYHHYLLHTSRPMKSFMRHTTRTMTLDAYLAYYIRPPAGQ